MNRRIASRESRDIFFNQYVDGYPHLCRSLNLSETGILLERLSVSAQGCTRDFYPVEIGLVPIEAADQAEEPLDEALGPVWLWAREVRRDGKVQALEFVSLEARDVEKLRRILCASAQQPQA